MVKKSFLQMVVSIFFNPGNIAYMSGQGTWRLIIVRGLNDESVKA